jgi:phage shock protein A
MNTLRRYRSALAERVRTLLAPAADPRHDLTAAAQRQRDLLALVRQAQTDLAQSRAQLSAKHDAAQATADQFDQQARLMLQVGRDDLARSAIQRQQRAAAEALLLAQQLDQMERQAQRLASHEQQLNDQIVAFVARINAIAARYTAAEAQVRMQEALGGLSHGPSDLDLVLERAEQETEDIHARASALDRLMAAGMLEQPSRADTLDRRLTQELAEEAISERLAVLRAELQQPDAQPLASE